MATDVDVQFFSHLNGLTLGNNWGDLIRLLDKCLVNGLPLTSITSASIDAQGDITLNLYAAHNCMLFQIVELTGFTPSEINGKYRVKGTPSANQLILKATHVGKTITTTGAAKLAPLGYDIIFRDANDVKRVYRAKNPIAQHPFIRIDETISDGVNSYSSAYVKYAMVGLIEHMEHIDDYANPNKLQLPFDPSTPEKNWKITGTGTSVIRGWSKLFWATSNYAALSNTPVNGDRKFTLCGDKDVFYIVIGTNIDDNASRYLYGMGVYESTLPASVIPPWCLLTPINSTAASQADDPVKGKYPLLYGNSERKFAVLDYDELTPYKAHIYCDPILPDNYTGMSSAAFTGTPIAALEIPIADESKRLRGTLKHVCYAGSNLTTTVNKTTPLQGESSMYVAELSVSNGNNTGAVIFYLGELE